MSRVEVPAPASLPPAPGADRLGRLAGPVHRLAEQQGGWPPRRPAQVARFRPDPVAPGGTVEQALAAGRDAADGFVDSGADLVVVAGSGSRTPALVLLAALLDRDPVAVTGTAGSPGWAAQVAEVRDRLRAARPHVADPVALLTAAGALDAARTAGLLGQCAVRRTPVLLSGAVEVCAAALVAQRLAPGLSGWLHAGCSPRSSTSAVALGELRLDPVLDLDLDDPLGAELALAALLGGVELAGGA